MDERGRQHGRVDERRKGQRRRKTVKSLLAFKRFELPIDDPR